MPEVLTSVKSFIAAVPDATSVPGAHAEPFHFRTCPVLGDDVETSDNPLNVEFNEITPELIWMPVPAEFVSGLFERLS